MSSAPRSRRTIGGLLLVALPELHDPHFRQTIVFMARHNHREGSLGFVMNRPLTATLGDVALSTGPLSELRDLPVFWGGPVATDAISLVLFQRAAQDNALRCTTGKDTEWLAPFVRRPGCWVRAFVGHSGWAAGQLKGELAEPSWRIALPHVALFDDRALPGLWPLLASGDERWRSLYTRLPRAPELN